MRDDSRKPSAVTLIRAQGEQIRRMAAKEYLKDKIGSDDADGHRRKPCYERE